MVDVREVIAEAVPCNIVYGRPQAADEIIHALTGAGFRIICPDEVDQVTDQWQPIETAPTNEEILVGGFIEGTWCDAVYEILDEFWREDWDDEPTHWMPLPLPPTIGRKA